jgi:hypothetical protein
MQTKIHSLRRRLATACVLPVMLCLCAALPVVSAKGDHFWTRALPGPVLPEPSKRYDPSFRFFLDLIRETLIAEGSYYNYSVKTQSPRTVIIDGVKTSDGTFWPTVKSLVTNDRSGTWLTIAEAPPAAGKHCTLKVEIEATTDNLSINLKGFEPFIAKYKFGKVTLTTGDSVVFSLSDLLPPKD